MFDPEVPFSLDIPPEFQDPDTSSSTSSSSPLILVVRARISVPGQMNPTIAITDIYQNSLLNLVIDIPGQTIMIYDDFVSIEAVTFRLFFMCATQKSRQFTT